MDQISVEITADDVLTCYCPDVALDIAATTSLLMLLFKRHDVTFSRCCLRHILHGVPAALL